MKAEEARCQLKLEVEAYLSNKERGQALCELIKHPAWYVIPEILQHIRTMTQKRMAVCRPDQLTCLQGQLFTVELMESTLINSLSAKDKEKAKKIY